nr:exosortase H-associated membrane protein [uncultured Roseateles sp.]
MRRPDRLRWFVLRVAIWLLLFYGLWLLIAPYLLQSLWLLSDTLWPQMFFSSERARIDIVEAGWRVHTAWPIASPADGTSSQAVTMIGQNSLKRMVSGFPLLMALLLATRGITVLRTLAALGCLWLISWLTITAALWHSLVVISGTHSEFFTAVRPPPYTVLTEAAPMWQFYLSGYLMYLAHLIIPFLAPVMLWAVLMRRHVTLMVMRLQSLHRARKTAQAITA